MFKRSAIIIVDDNELVGRALRRQVQAILKRLNQESAHIILANGGDEVLQLINEHEEAHEGYDYLLITDGDMPGMNGPEVIRLLDERLGDRLVIRVICSANPDYKADASELSASFVSKPLTDVSFHLEHFFGYA